MADEERARRGRPTAPASRKEKSLGLLCERFCTLHASEQPGTELSLDANAAALGVERRRMYDVVGVLEACEVVVRTRKNVYLWHNRKRLASCFARLRESALRAGISQGSGDGEDGESDEDAAGRKDASLHSLAQRFIKLFLTAAGSVSLEDAAQRLLGDGLDEQKQKTKVRRLYDVANVLLSLQLIEKTQAESRKPAYRWLGVPDDAAADSAELPAAAATPQAMQGMAVVQAAVPRARAPPSKRRAATGGAIAAPAASPEAKKPRREARARPRGDGIGGTAAPPAVAAPPAGEDAPDALVATLPAEGATAWSYHNVTNDAILSRFISVVASVATNAAGSAADATLPAQ